MSYELWIMRKKLIFNHSVNIFALISVKIPQQDLCVVFTFPDAKWAVKLV